jgi:hypothetical protein
MTPDDLTENNLMNKALDSGRARARQILATRTVARARRKQALLQNNKKLTLKVQLAPDQEPATIETSGFLAAAGDSWFDYPLHDVLKLLDDEYGYNIESTAHKGDPIEKMAYKGGQMEDFPRTLEKIKDRGAVPKAVLVSGGGDDVAGSEFGMLLNNAFGTIAGWDDAVVDGVLNVRIKTAYVDMLGNITEMCVQMFKKTIPILVHGYDYPVPDGRGFLGGWPFPGPWLDPGFREKNFPNDDDADLQTRIAMMKTTMDKFNVMVGSLAAYPDLAHVRYIDLRGTLSTQLNDYKAWWANELHPTERGFEMVTNKFAAVLAALP